MIASLIEKYRFGKINQKEMKCLFSKFQKREPSVLRFMKRANGLYEVGELLSVYYEGIMRAMVGKKKDGTWITDLDRTDTIVSKIWSHGIGYAKSFIYKNSQKKLVVECEKCGHLNRYHSTKCIKCHTFFSAERKTFMKEANINFLIQNEISEGKKFDFIQKDLSNNMENVEKGVDFSIFITKLKKEFKNRKLKNYNQIVDLLTDKKILNSPNYLKKLSKELKISPQAVNTKIKRMKKIAQKSGISL
jgi:RNase P subunit RPR2